MQEWAKSQKDLAKRANDFHAHLDVCERCRNEPFNLCAEGAKKLQATVSKP